MEGTYTAGAERVLEAAQRLAEERGLRTIEPLDLLAALVEESESRAADLLRLSGYETEVVLEALVSRRVRGGGGNGEGAEGAAPVPSVELRAVLTESALAARGLNRAAEIGTEHLLAGLLAASSEARATFESISPEGLDALRDRLEAPGELAQSELPLLEGVGPLDLGQPELADLGRLLDAAANRAREGLRVVEDYARFVLDDPAITRRLKEIRHRLAEAERGLAAHRPIEARDTPGDVGGNIMTPSEQIRENPRAVLTANFKRVQESLRSLEEYAKLIDVWLAGRFEVLRYDLYTVEKMMLTAAAAHRTLDRVRLMVLAGGMATPGDLTWVVEEALKAGADAIQYRDKDRPDRERLSLARELRIITAMARRTLIINDRPDLALLARADGVHVGLEDLSIKDARRVLGSAGLIGASTHSPADLERASLAGANYCGVGPVFQSQTKRFDDLDLAGLALVEHAAQTTTRPWFAIGGIHEDNLKRVLDAGATRIAVSAAVLRAQRPGRAVERLKAILEGADPPDDDDE